MSNLNPTANDWQILAECFMKQPNHRGRKGWVSAAFDDTDLMATKFAMAATACYGSERVYVYTEREARITYGSNTVVIGVNYEPFVAPPLSDVLSIEFSEFAGILRWQMVGDLRQAVADAYSNVATNKELTLDLNGVCYDHEHSCSYWYADSEERLVQLRESIANELGVKV